MVSASSSKIMTHDNLADKILTSVGEEKVAKLLFVNIASERARTCFLFVSEFVLNNVWFMTSARGMQSEKKVMIVIKHQLMRN